MKIIARINKKTGAVTLKTEGFQGESCLEATKKLRADMGIEAEPERTSEFYTNEETTGLSTGA